MIDEHDNLNRRCPQLGGPVPFLYCRAMNRKLPCGRIIQCWAGKLDIAVFLETNYSEEDLKSAFQTDPRTKYQKIVEIAGQARKNNQS